MTDRPEQNRKRQRIGRSMRSAAGPSSTSTSISTRAMTTRSQSRSQAVPSKPAGKTAEIVDDSNITASVEEPGERVRKRKADSLLESSAHCGDNHEDADDSDDADSCQGDVVLTSKYISELTGDEEIIAKLGFVFSDPCTLARSFPQTDHAMAAKCPVDVEDVRKAYSFIANNTSEKVLDELRLLTISTVAMMSLDPCDEHDNQMNAVLIILLNPRIIEYTHDDNIHVFPELCSVILNQPLEQRAAIMRYFAAADDEQPSDSILGELRKPKPSTIFSPQIANITGAVQTPTKGDSNNSSGSIVTEDTVVSFAYYVSIFQSYITRETDRAARGTASLPAPASSAEPTLKKVCLHSLSGCSLPLVAQCLALMNSHNNSHNIVPYTIFYNDAVNEHIDTKEEVPRFRVPKGVSFCSYPFLLSPTTKSEIIRIESMIHMRTELQDSFFRAMFSGVTCPYLVLEVRRDSLVRDTLYQLELKLSQDLRKQLKVRFVGEEGVDEGGVQKEFFQLIVRDVFSSKYGIFKANNESQYHWFIPQAAPTKDSLEEIWLTGQLIGLAVYNGVILDIHLPPAMYKKLLGVPVTRDDLREIDPALYHGLMQLQQMSNEELEFLERTFEVEYDDLGQLRTHELLPDGAKTILAADNRELFIDKYVDFIFNTSCTKQFAEFKAGFDRICGPSYVRFMQPQELELLVCGCSDLDFNALQNSTIYDGGYSKTSEVILYFWKVVGEFTDELKRKLLFFATSSDRVPIGGLSKLQFVIAKNGGDSDRLPTSHTCFNVLLLPEYSSLEKLRERLLTAIHNSEGFGMI